MIKTLFITSSVLLLMSIVLASGCTQTTQLSGTDYYESDLYKRVPKAEHEKRFPNGHQKTKDDENKHCYYEEGTAAYFCQYWEDWEG